MKVVYIAGPFRGKNSWEIEQNIRLAENYALEIWSYGAAVICPHTNTRFFHGALPDSTWLEGDLEILKRCDAVVMLLDWHLSEGAKKEKELAESLGLVIFLPFQEHKIRAWVKDDPNWRTVVGC